LRLVLSEEEVQVMRIAGEMGVAGMETFMSLLEEGATEKELSAESTLAMEKMLAKKYPWCETTVGGRAYLRCTFGLKTLHVHGGGTGDSKLRKGYVVQANAIPFVNGYMCSLERTVVFGRPSDKQREAYEAMLEAREKGIEMLKPGIKCSEIYWAAKDILNKSGYGKYIRHTLGHSHGILNWLSGWLRLGNIVPWDDTVLREGMVTSILLGVYVPELGGFRHGDMFLITKNGHENLTDYDRGLLIKEPST
jgi:Xaa-Pro aminopeptidase